MSIFRQHVIPDRIDSGGERRQACLKALRGVAGFYGVDRDRRALGALDLNRREFEFDGLIRSTTWTLSGACDTTARLPGTDLTRAACANATSGTPSSTARANKLFRNLHSSLDKRASH